MPEGLAGEAKAERVYKGGALISSLLKVLDVPEETADKDACNMEHNLHPITIVQLKKFISFVEHCPKGLPDWLACFREYSRTGTFPDDCKA